MPFYSYGNTSITSLSLILIIHLHYLLIRYINLASTLPGGVSYLFESDFLFDFSSVLLNHLKLNSSRYLILNFYNTLTYYVLFCSRKTFSWEQIMCHLYSHFQNLISRKKSNADRYQYYLKRQENENSLIDSGSIHDVEEPLLEVLWYKVRHYQPQQKIFLMKILFLKSLTFHVSVENSVKEYMEKSVQTDEIK